MLKHVNFLKGGFVTGATGATTGTTKRDYKAEYRKYHGTPEQRKNRSLRNQARRKAGLEKGDPREVDHGKPLSAGGTNHGNNLHVVSREENRRKGSKT